MVGATTFMSLFLIKVKVSNLTGKSSAPDRTKNKHNPGAVK